jgi:hypothetical protein
VGGYGWGISGRGFYALGNRYVSGKQEKTYEIARKMLGLVDDRTICEFTGLSLTELEDVKPTFRTS